VLFDGRGLMEAGAAGVIGGGAFAGLPREEDFRPREEEDFRPREEEDFRPREEEDFRLREGAAGPREAEDARQRGGTVRRGQGAGAKHAGDGAGMRRGGESRGRDSGRGPRGQGAAAAVAEGQGGASAHRRVRWEDEGSARRAADSPGVAPVDAVAAGGAGRGGGVARRKRRRHRDGEESRPAWNGSVAVEAGEEEGAVEERAAMGRTGRQPARRPVTTRRFRGMVDPSAPSFAASVSPAATPPSSDDEAVTGSDDGSDDGRPAQPAEPPAPARPPSPVEVLRAATDWLAAAGVMVAGHPDHRPTSPVRALRDGVVLCRAVALHEARAGSRRRTVLRPRGEVMADEAAAEAAGVVGVDVCEVTLAGAEPYVRPKMREWRRAASRRLELALSALRERPGVPQRRLWATEELRAGRTEAWAELLSDVAEAYGGPDVGKEAARRVAEADGRARAEAAARAAEEAAAARAAARAAAEAAGLESGGSRAEEDGEEAAGGRRDGKARRGGAASKRLGGRRAPSRRPRLPAVGGRLTGDAPLALSAVGGHRAAAVVPAAVRRECLRAVAVLSWAAEAEAEQARAVQRSARDAISHAAEARAARAGRAAEGAADAPILASLADPRLGGRSRPASDPDCRALPSLLQRCGASAVAGGGSVLSDPLFNGSVAALLVRLGAGAAVAGRARVHVSCPTLGHARANLAEAARTWRRCLSHLSSGAGAAADAAERAARGGAASLGPHNEVTASSPAWLLGSARIAAAEPAAVCAAAATGQAGPTASSPSHGGDAGGATTDVHSWRCRLAEALWLRERPLLSGAVAREPVEAALGPARAEQTLSGDEQVAWWGLQSLVRSLQPRVQRLLEAGARRAGVPGSPARAALSLDSLSEGVGGAVLPWEVAAARSLVVTPPWGREGSFPGAALPEEERWARVAAWVGSEGVEGVWDRVGSEEAADPRLLAAAVRAGGSVAVLRRSVARTTPPSVLRAAAGAAADLLAGRLAVSLLPAVVEAVRAGPGERRAALDALGGVGGGRPFDKAAPPVGARDSARAVSEGRGRRETNWACVMAALRCLGGTSLGVLTDAAGAAISACGVEEVAPGPGSPVRRSRVEAAALDGAVCALALLEEVMRAVESGRAGWRTGGGGGGKRKRPAASPARRDAGRSGGHAGVSAGHGRAGGLGAPPRGSEEAKEEEEEEEDEQGRGGVAGAARGRAGRGRKWERGGGLDLFPGDDGTTMAAATPTRRRRAGGARMSPPVSPVSRGRRDDSMMSSRAAPVTPGRARPAAGSVSFAGGALTPGTGRRGAFDDGNDDAEAMRRSRATGLRSPPRRRVFSPGASAARVDPMDIVPSAADHAYLPSASAGGKAVSLNDPCRSPRDLRALPAASRAPPRPPVPGVPPGDRTPAGIVLRWLHALGEPVQQPWALRTPRALEFSDGVLLCRLVERLETAAGRMRGTLRGVDPAPRTAAARLQNTRRALAVLRTVKGMPVEHLWSDLAVRDGSTAVLVPLLLQMRKLYAAQTRSEVAARRGAGARAEALDGLSADESRA